MPSAGGEVVALEIRPVHSAGDIDRLLERARPLRSATSTAVYQITVQIAQNDNEFFTSKFSFVELAWVTSHFSYYHIVAILELYLICV
jgi:hypothetical protein